MLHDYSGNPVLFDFETQSAADLPEIGGRLYAECPSTRVLSLSALIDRELHIWIPKGVASEYRGEIYLPPEYRPLYDTLTLHQSEKLPESIEAAVASGRVFAAHNCCGFDRFIWEECVTRRGLGSLPRKWADTLYLARLAGLPRGGLDAVAEAILGTSKDAAKKIVMPLTRAEWVNGEVEYPRVLSGMIDPLVRYCSVDTLILAQLWDKFADLSVEQDAIQAHQNINDRGIAVDLSLSTRLVIVAAEASRRAAEEIEKETKGELYGDTVTRKGNLRSTEKVHAWLKKHGVEITMQVAGESGNIKKRTLRKDVVEQYLANPLLMLGEDTEVSLEVLKNFNEDVLPLVRKVLRLRVTATRITSAKAEKMGKRERNGRIYDLHTYHKAHTGRASSQGVQIHNMPRGKKGVKVAKLLQAHENGEWPKDASKAYDFIYSECLDPAERAKGLTVDDALSSLIRPCFLAKKGHKLGIADYAAIECRGIAWIAGEEKLLEAFSSGRDVYCEFASILYGKTVTKDMKVERQVGKIVILGCGYGMGVEKFALTAALQNIDLKKAGTSAEKCVETYRAAYQKIAGHYAGSFHGRAMRRGGIWEQLNTAAMRAVVEGGRHTAGKCHFVYACGVLRVTLPSGRELRYNNCRVEDRVPSYAISLGLDAKTRPTIVYVGERGETSMYGGKWAENLVQAICRDILYTALIRGEMFGVPFVADIHDETVGEYEERLAAEYLEKQCVLMSHPPEWADGFPITVEGYTSRRYVKECEVGEYQVTSTNGEITHAGFKNSD